MHYYTFSLSFPPFPSLLFSHVFFSCVLSLPSFMTFYFPLIFSSQLPMSSLSHSLSLLAPSPFPCVSFSPYLICVSRLTLPSHHHHHPHLFPLSLSFHTRGSNTCSHLWYIVIISYNDSIDRLSALLVPLPFCLPLSVSRWYFAQDCAVLVIAIQDCGMLVMAWMASSPSPAHATAGPYTSHNPFTQCTTNY